MSTPTTPTTWQWQRDPSQPSAQHATDSTGCEWRIVAHGRSTSVLAREEGAGSWDMICTTRLGITEAKALARAGAGE